MTRVRLTWEPEGEVDSVVDQGTEGTGLAKDGDSEQAWWKILGIEVERLESGRWLEVFCEEPSCVDKGEQRNVSCLLTVRTELESDGGDQVYMSCRATPATQGGKSGRHQALVN